MSDSPEEKSYWQGHRAGTARLAETQRELTTKLEECIGLNVLVDDLRAQVRTLEKQVREAQDQYARAAEASAKAQTELKLQIKALQSGEQACWHCYDVLASNGPANCEKCPTFNDCDVEGCTAPGCAT